MGGGSPQQLLSSVGTAAEALLARSKAGRALSAPYQCRLSDKRACAHELLPLNRAKLRAESNMAPVSSTRAQFDWNACSLVPAMCTGFAHGFATGGWKGGGGGLHPKQQPSTTVVILQRQTFWAWIWLTVVNV